jgi:sialidase-1
VFVEFAVNDGGMDDRKSMETFEGVLRQLLSTDNVPAICIVYTIAKEHLEIWHTGELSPRAATQEQLAEYYQLPSVRMARGIADQVMTGQTTWEELMNDIVHPLDAGHQIYSQVLIAALKQMFEQEPVQDYQLPTPLVSDRYATATMQVLPRDVPGWAWIDLENKGGWECFTGLLMAEKPGTELILSFTGKLVGLYYQLGPDTGNLHYCIDDGPEQLLEPFDKWAVNCKRPQYRVLNDELTEGQHTLTLRIASSKDQQSQGTWTRLAHVMVGE